MIMRNELLGGVEELALACLFWRLTMGLATNISLSYAWHMYKKSSLNSNNNSKISSFAGPRVHLTRSPISD